MSILAARAADLAAGSGIAPAAGSVFVNDSMTDTAGVVLSSHTADSGGLWTNHPSGGGASTQITNANRAGRTTGTGQSIYYAAGTPTTAEYDVEADFFIASSAVTSVGIFGRLNTTTGENGYMIRCSGTDWKLFEVSGGTYTQIGATYVGSVTVGQTYHVRLAIRNSVKKVYIDGIERMTATNNAITAAGRVGTRMGTLTQTDAVGIHVDNVKATNV